MKMLTMQLLILLSLLMTNTAFAFPEIPFCPAGGPPGWMNYLESRHNQNKWYGRQYPPAYYYSNYNQLRNHNLPFNQHNNAYRNHGHQSINTRHKNQQPIFYRTSPYAHEPNYRNTVRR